MPTGTIVVVAAITLAFGVFAVTLAWADRRTARPETKSARHEVPSAMKADANAY